MYKTSEEQKEKKNAPQQSYEKFIFYVNECISIQNAHHIWCIYGLTNEMPKRKISDLQWQFQLQHANKTIREFVWFENMPENMFMGIEEGKGNNIRKQ